MANTNKYFTIMVLGSTPSEVEEGFLNKTTGLPDGKTEKMKLEVGVIHIPNFSRAWAYQELKNGVPTGRLVFTKWGETYKEGKVEHQCRPVEIRYLRNSTSLDKQYQDQVLKIMVRDEDAQLSLVNGLNDYNTVVEAPLVEMIKYHTFNKDNKSRDPYNKEMLYSEYNPANLNTKETSDIRRRNKAELIILDAEGNDERLVVLANLFELDPQSQSDILFNELLEEVKNFDQFLKVIDVTKERFRFVLENLKANKKLEFNEGDVVLTIDNTREALYTGINVEDKIQFLVEGILEPDIYEVYIKAQKVNEILMEVLN